MEVFFTDIGLGLPGHKIRLINVINLALYHLTYTVAVAIVY